MTSLIVLSDVTLRGNEADLMEHNVTTACSVHTARTALHPPISLEIVAVSFKYSSMSLSLGGLVWQEHSHPMLQDRIGRRNQLGDALDRRGGWRSSEGLCLV